jgi:hypothetical protein
MKMESLTRVLKTRVETYLILDVFSGSFQGLDMIVNAQRRPIFKGNLIIRPFWDLA